MSSISFAVVGCGAIGNRHVKHLVENSSIELIAVCDLKLDLAQKIADELGILAYSSLTELIQYQKNIDVINICTPNSTHAALTIEALKAGSHVICEKPMALNSADCQRMIDTAEKYQKLLFVVKQNRFNPPVAALKKTISENRLGKIYMVILNCFWNRNKDYYLNSDWKGTKALDGGVLFTQFSHFIDLLYWLVGGVKAVSAVHDNFGHDNIEFEDSGVILLQFDNGAIGTINYTICSYQKNMEGSITIFAENGTVKVGGQYLNVLEYQNVKDYEMQHPPVNRPANDYGYYQGSMSNHDKVIQNVIDTICGNANIATTGDEGMKTVEIIEQIIKASQNAK